MLSINTSLKTINHKIRQIADRRKFAASIRTSDLFVVAYPKSGTTWLAFLMANILKSDPNESLNLRNFIKYTPDVNKLYSQCDPLSDFEHLADPRIFLVHAAYTPIFPKVVYVVRDPRDVIVSYWHYKKLTVPDFNLSMKEFVNAELLQPYRWDTHVAGWLDHSADNLLLVSYEALHRDAEAVLGRVLDFADIGYNQAVIAEAVEAGRFDRMQAVDEQFGWAGAVKKGRFVRRGKIGAWRDELDDDCMQTIERAFGPVMQRVGYRLNTTG